MDRSKFVNFQRTFAKTQQGDMQCTLNGQVVPGVDVVATWSEIRAETLADPLFAGLTHDADSEDVNLAKSHRTITSTLRFVGPKVPLAPVGVPAPATAVAQAPLRGPPPPPTLSAQAKA